MSYKDAIEFVRTQLKVQVEHRKLENKADRYFRKLEHNRPKVNEEPKYPEDLPSDQVWFDITAVHTVYNEMKNKPNAHAYKDSNCWDAYTTNRAVKQLKEYLEENFEIAFDKEVANAS